MISGNDKCSVDRTESGVRELSGGGLSDEMTFEPRLEYTEKEPQESLREELSRQRGQQVQRSWGPILREALSNE